MNTTTILSAYIKARDKRFALNAPHKRFRQCNMFRNDLLLRIEQGDRAREALKEKREGRFFPFCPMCGEEIIYGHAPDCPRQLAPGD